MQITEQSIIVKVKKINNLEWEITLQGESVSKMIEIETSSKVLYSDNYFSLTPERKKIVVMKALNLNDIPKVVEISVVDSTYKKEFTL